MERTESTVVSVAPDYENEKIREMALFGWNLQSRQEIIGPLREAPVSDNLLVAMYRGGMEGATGKKIYERDHYVKLHFVRSLDLPNLGRIKQLEAELRALPTPTGPGLLWPIIFTIMPIPGGLAMLADPLGQQGSPGLLGFPVAVGWFLLGLYWIRSRRRKRAEAEEICANSYKRAEEIGQELSTLIDVSNL